jgi:hypothetical protein
VADGQNMLVAQSSEGPPQMGKCLRVGWAWVICHLSDQAGAFDSQHSGRLTWGKESKKHTVHLPLAATGSGMLLLLETGESDDCLEGRSYQSTTKGNGKGTKGL